MLPISKALLLLRLLLGVQGTAISHVGSIFEVFTARSLLRFFEFNGGAYNLTQPCAQQVFQYLEALQQDRLWSIRMLDASGYYAGGIYEANELRLADPEQCFALNQKDQDRALLDPFLNLTTAPWPVRAVVARYRLHIPYSPFQQQQVFQSVCLPQICDDSDLSQILSYNFIPNAKFNRFIENVELVSFRVLRSSSDAVLETQFLLALGIMALVAIVLLTCASLCSMNNRRSLDLKLPDDDFTPLSGKINPNVLRRMTMSSDLESLPRNSLGLKMTNDKLDKENSYTNVKMRPDDEQMTISNFSSNNHVNLVKVKKIETDNMISLDIISANCYNAFILQRKTQKDLEASSYSGHFKQLCSALSWQTQLSSLEFDILDLKTSHNDCLNGLRVLSTTWLILIHVCRVLFSVADNKTFVGQIDSGWFLPFLLANGSYAFDIFFFTSGLDLFHLFHSTMRRNQKKLYHVCHQLAYFSLMILFKVLKVVFVYSAAIFLLAVTAGWSHQTSPLELPSNDHVTCRQTFWRNLLFADVFFPLEERCMIWSWYIPVELIFFIIAVLLLMLARTHPYFAITLFTSFFISSFFTTAIMKMEEDTRQTSFNSTMSANVLAEINLLYDQPWIRIAPYLIGISFGFFLQKNDASVKVGLFPAAAGWMFSTCLVFLIFFGPLYMTGEVDLRILSVFASFSHGIWSLVLTWVIFSTISGHGGLIGRLLSLRVFHPLAKISNCVLLIHPLVTRSLIAQGSLAVHMSLETLALLFIGFTVVSYAAGFVAYILFESPVLSILSLVLEPRVQRN